MVTSTVITVQLSIYDLEPLNLINSVFGKTIFMLHISSVLIIFTRTFAVVFSDVLGSYLYVCIYLFSIYVFPVSLPMGMVFFFSTI